MAVYQFPVRLTPIAPDGKITNHLFYDALIPSAVVSQSAVLSTVLDLGNGSMTSLPDQVPLSDFEMWKSAVIAKHNGKSLNEEGMMDLSTACTVLKVQNYATAHLCLENPDVILNAVDTMTKRTGRSFRLLLFLMTRNSKTGST